MTMQDRATASAFRGRSGSASLARLVVFSALIGACVLDADDRCSEHQELYDDKRCVCAAGHVFTPTGCVACGEHEVASPAGCVCAAGFVRAAGEATCSEPPADAGGLCGSDAGCGG